MNNISNDDKMKIKSGSATLEKSLNPEEEESFHNKEAKEEEKVPELGGVGRINREYGAQYRCSQIVAFVSAFLNGCVLPFFGVAFRQILTILTKNTIDSEDVNLQKEALKAVAWFAGVGVFSLIFTLLQYQFFGIYGSKVSIAIRKAYFQKMLSQDIAFHDKETSNKINALVTTDCNSIQEGISTKMGFFVQQLGTFICGMGIAFYYSWELSLVLVGCVPVLLLAGFFQAKIFLGQGGGSSDPFAKPGAFSQEVLTNIRTVLAFPDLVKTKLLEYKNLISDAVPIEIKRQQGVGVSLGFFMFAILGVMYSVAIYSGARFVQKDYITVGNMFGAFFSFFIGGMGLGQLGSVLGDIAKAKLAANKFFLTMKRIPDIRPPDSDGKVIGSGGTKTKLKGHIRFDHVSFAYPSNPATNVLHHVSFEIPIGKSLAIVGPSGSGKSTIVQLLERFYDPTEGDIFIDGHKIHNLQMEYLRSHIGLVSQMPLLFDSSIAENIRGGLLDVTQQDIEHAASLANAHDFIIKLPDGYKTNVGEMGGRLSGGQRQRIAIARALLTNPVIMILDEATSALDTKSEREVQEALDKIQKELSMTTIAIAHRLSTIKDCDEIIVLKGGVIQERGTHNTLMKEDQVYATLVRSQQLIQLHRLRSRTKSVGSLDGSSEKIKVSIDNQNINDGGPVSNQGPVDVSPTDHSGNSGVAHSNYEIPKDHDAPPTYDEL